MHRKDFSLKAFKAGRGVRLTPVIVGEEPMTINARSAQINVEHPEHCGNTRILEAFWGPGYFGERTVYVSGMLIEDEFGCRTSDFPSVARVTPNGETLKVTLRTTAE